MRPLIVTLLVMSVTSIAQTLAAPPSDPKDGASEKALDQRIAAEIAQFKGTVGIFAKNLETGRTFGWHENERVRTASTIKLPIMVEAFQQVHDGRAHWEDEVVLTKEKIIRGSGILFELHDGLKLTLRDALHLMIVLSDNTATNLVLDVIGTDAVNSRMSELGLVQTRLLRKVGPDRPQGISAAGRDPNNARFGLGVTTPREMVTLLEKIERGEAVNAAASSEMIAILKRQQDHRAIGRNLTGIAIASKAGALNNLRSDVGIVYTKRGRIAMAMSCDEMPEVIWNDENPAFLLMGRLSALLLEL
jgi:beta-lactamase class A